jgi:SAM-dependent methyltransferase
MRPFVDYYGARNISPVAQDISDVGRHFERRASLYRSLGIPPLYVRGRSVIEFGPGSGYNALYTAYLDPSRYLMVDANPRGVNETRALLAARYPGAANHELVHSLIEEFDSGERFDLVLAEGLIPFQMNPAAFAEQIARFAGPRAILVVTCADAPSIIGEIGRRLIAYRVAGRELPEDERLRRLVPLFGPHLKTLTGMSRSVEDWIEDNVLIPFVGKTFGIDEAVAALGDSFDVYGSSPQFTTDLRWYKQLYGEERRFNERTATAYLENMMNFLDCRVTLPPHDAALGVSIRDLCRRIYQAMQTLEAGDGQEPAGDVAPLVRELAGLAERSPRTARALEELADALEIDPVSGVGERLNEFVSFFGRGMQYLSFIRR